MSESRKPIKKAEVADFPRFEAETLKVWEDEKTFEQSLKLREDKQRFSFYDGPPFANGLPHFGHSLVTSIKDSLGRYKTMRGYYVERRNGWDCHGLPVEFAIEKQLGVSGKKQILELGLDKFNQACRDSVFKYKGDWEDFFRRIGRWTETDRAYATIDTAYTESVWWALGKIDQKGLLYKGYKSMPYCPRCETPISNFELNEGYKDDVSDPSVYVLFPLRADESTALLAWTTTPWSLPANMALAVKAGAKYVKVRLKEKIGNIESVVVAKKRLETVDYSEILNEFDGESLSLQKFVPLYRSDKVDWDEYQKDEGSDYGVIMSDDVSLDDGTGVLHVAPAYGEVDLKLAQEKGLTIIYSVDRSGRFVAESVEDPGLDLARGRFFKAADKLVIEDLTGKNRIYAAQTFAHTYPFCYRCESPLLYFAISTWFIKVSAVRSELLKTANQINWTPEHIKDGRFGKWLEGARDWAISRNRYWGAPLPIWVNEDDETDYILVSSLKELKKLAGEKAELDDLHRPYIDKVTFLKEGKRYKRVEEVFDCWFESGSMPVAQQHYPFENQSVFDESFPADYIGEGLDQTRLWFYVLHVISTILFDRPAYKNVLVNGMIMAADGQKLSKRLKNYPPVEEVFATEGADSLRLYLLGSDQALGGDYMRFSRDALRDTQRNVFMTLWNVYSFFSTYAEVDGWSAADVERRTSKVESGGSLSEPKSENVLDQWMISRLNQVIQEVTLQADDYKIAAAVRPIRELIDDLSNWYVRRSRRRFWKSEDDGDKTAAYATLHYVLVRMAQLLAPWAPFISDKLYRELTVGMGLPASVHLTDWPAAGDVDEALLVSMSEVRAVVQEALAKRAEAKIKVRQPLAKLTVFSTLELSDELKSIIAEEVNVKEVVQFHRINPQGHELDTEITQALKQEGLAREVVRHIQSARKSAGLEVDDRIHLKLGVRPSSDLEFAIKANEDLIKHETLALGLEYTEQDSGQIPVMVEGEQLYTDLKKATDKSE